MISLMDMIVAGYDFKFKMGWPRAYGSPAVAQLLNSN